MDTVFIKCKECGILFERKKSEHNRSIRLDRPEYCSRSCVGRALNNNIRKDPTLVAIRLKNLKKGGRKLNTLSPFRSLIRNIKNRCKYKKKKILISAGDLRDLWNKQEGKCFYSRLKMNLPKDSNGFRGKPLIRNISVDRINSEGSYTKSNIVLCCYGANIGKGIWSTREYINFCKLVGKCGG